MATSDKLKEIAENVPKVYEAAKTKYGSKATVEGEIVVLERTVEQGKKVKVNLSSDTLPSDTVVTLKSYSRNFFKLNRALIDAPSQLNVTVEDNKLIVSCVNSGSGWNSCYTRGIMPLAGIERVYIKTKYATTGLLTTPTITAWIYDTETKTRLEDALYSGGASGTDFILTMVVPEKYRSHRYYLQLFFYGRCGETCNAGDSIIYSDITVTPSYADYEPYTEGETITTTIAKGAEMELIAPNMTIITDTDGVVVSAEYWQGDTNLFEIGKQAGVNSFWRTYLTPSGNISHMFSGPRWTDDIFKCPINIRPNANGTYAINVFERTGIKDLKGCLERQGVYIDLSKYAGSNGLQNWFYDSQVTHIGRILFPENITTYSNTFYNCKHLHTIDELPFSVTTKVSTNTFYNCTALENINVTGTIGVNGFKISWSTKLTHDSLMSIINALEDKSADTSGTIWEVTLGAENLAKLTQDEIAIAENKGWNLG